MAGRGGGHRGAAAASSEVPDAAQMWHEYSRSSREEVEKSAAVPERGHKPDTQMWERRGRLKDTEPMQRAHRGVQPAAHGPQAAQDGCECGQTQNHKFT